MKSAMQNADLIQPKFLKMADSVKYFTSFFLIIHLTIMYGQGNVWSCLQRGKYSIYEKENSVEENIV